jgi:hypothetical protein
MAAFFLLLNSTKVPNFQDAPVINTTNKHGFLFIKKSVTLDIFNPVTSHTVELSNFENFSIKNKLRTAQETNC